MLFEAGFAGQACAPVDFTEAGSGPLVILVHSSMTGARQWTSLSAELERSFRVRALNLFGYGDTPPWSGPRPPSLADYAELVAAVVPPGVEEVSLVGHSFGGAVAMKAAAAQLRGRVRSLVLIEPSPFYLLGTGRRYDALDEVLALAEQTLRAIAYSEAERAAQLFVDYWCGEGTWSAHPPSRQRAILRSVAGLRHEWIAVLEERTGLAEWTAALPSETLLMAFADTVRPSRELVEILADANPHWEVATLREGGHMGPLTHPHIVNPIVRDVLLQAHAALQRAA